MPGRSLFYDLLQELANAHEAEISLLSAENAQLRETFSGQRARGEKESSASTIAAAIARAGIESGASTVAAQGEATARGGKQSDASTLAAQDAAALWGGKESGASAVAAQGEATARGSQKDDASTLAAQGAAALRGGKTSGASTVAAQVEATARGGQKGDASTLAAQGVAALWGGKESRASTVAAQGAAATVAPQAKVEEAEQDSCVDDLAPPEEASAVHARVADRAHYEAMIARVAIRSKPSTEASAVGCVFKGSSVAGLPCTLSNVPWLRLDEEDRKRLQVPSEEAWVMIHGGVIGKGQLLRKFSPEEEKEALAKEKGEELHKSKGLDEVVQQESPSGEDVQGEDTEIHGKRAMAAPAHFEATNARVAIRLSPSTDAACIGCVFKGEIVGGLPYKFNEDPWLRLDHLNRRRLKIQSEEAWLLIYGGSKGMGQLLQKFQPDEEEDQRKADAELARKFQEDDEAAEEAKRKKAEKKRIKAEQEAKAMVLAPEASTKQSNDASATDKHVFEVVHKLVNVRSSPRVMSEVLGVVPKGDRVTGVPYNIAGSPWLSLNKENCRMVGIKADHAWVLIHSGKEPLMQSMDPGFDEKSLNVLEGEQ